MQESLQPLASAVAYILEDHQEWSADTLDAIAHLLVVNGHAEYVGGMFRATKSTKYPEGGE